MTNKLKIGKKLESIEVNDFEKDINAISTLNKKAFKLFKSKTTEATKNITKAFKLSKKIDYKFGIGEFYLINGLILKKDAKFEPALKSLTKALKIFVSLKKLDHVQKCFHGIGYIHNHNKDFKNNLLFFKNTLKINKELGSQKGMSMSIMSIGNFHYTHGDYDKSLKYFKNALIMARSINNSRMVAHSFNNIGLIYQIKGQLSLALENLYQSLSIHRKNNDRFNIAGCLANIGNINDRENKHEKALKNYHLAYKILKELKETTTLGHVTGNLAKLFNKLKNYPESLKYYNEALTIFKAVLHKEGIAQSLNGIGNVYINQQSYQLAKEKYSEALKIHQETKGKLGICESMLGLGKVNYYLESFEKALQEVKESEKICEAIEAKDLLIENYELQSNIYAKLEDFKKAFEYHQKFKQLHDTIFNENNIQKLTQLEDEYRFKEERNQAKIKEIKLSKKIESKEKKFLKSENQKIIIEQKLLRSQMTPHFIFNSLAVLHGMILNNEQRNAISYLSKFSKLLRSNLEKSREKLLSIQDELITIEDYIDIQNIGKKNSIKFNLIIDVKPSLNDLFIPPMILQPFIENAIEHGFKSNQIEKIISLELSYNNKQLVCLIKDNGIGFKKRLPTKKKKSLSTAITKERLAILSKEFQLKAHLSIENRNKFNEKGTLVTIYIPYKHKNQ